MKNQAEPTRFIGDVNGISFDIVFPGHDITKEFIDALSGVVDKVKDVLPFIDTSSVGVINIELVDSRDKYDERIGEKTQNWESGRVINGNLVIFDINEIEENTSHSKSEYAEILTHEISHMFMRSVNKKMLDWVNEGVAQFVAGQGVYRIPNNEERSYFFSHDFLELTDYREFINRNGYAISLLLIHYIVARHGKAVLCDLINLDGRKNSLKELEALFGEVLTDVEKGFRNFIDSKDFLGSINGRM